MHESILKLVSDIVNQVDYDIWKQSYNPDTAECSPDDGEENLEELAALVIDQLDDVFEKARLLVANDFMYTATHGMKPFFDSPPHKLNDMKRQLGEEQFKCVLEFTFDDMWESGHEKTFREMCQ